MPRLRDLNDGQAFLFPEGVPVVKEARGNGWYGRLGGYDGGPHHDHGRNPEVIPVGPGTGMPAKNYHCGQIEKDRTDVELRGHRGSQYYVATLHGVEGVVTMDGQARHEQQQFLDKCCAATLARRAQGIPAEEGRPRCRSRRRAPSAST
jgi:hypothetical protein